MVAEDSMEEAVFTGVEVEDSSSSSSSRQLLIRR
jgi:hypothetical protein